MPDTESEQRVISEWVLLQKKNGIEIGEIKWLDSPPRRGDIEAIAPPFAIEHTSIDRIENQRLLEDQFKRVVQDLHRIALSPPARLSVSLSLEDFLKVDHKKLRVALDQWLKKEASGLKEGHSAGSTICGISVRWWCWKYKERPPHIIIGLAVDLEKYGKDISDLVREKSNKLGSYKRQSFTTVLIIESRDFQLMAPDVFLEMILGVQEEYKTFIDQLWFADTSLNDIEYWRVIPTLRQLNGPYNLVAGTV